MSRMTDPTAALVSFQQALLDNELQLMPGELDPDLSVLMDNPQGHTRLTYVYVDGRTVIALAMFVLVEPLDDLTCFHTGVAVPEKYRGKGLAKKVMAAGIAELRHGLRRNNVANFAIEAVVSVTNEASKHVAEAIISKTPTEVKDSFTGEAALQYVLKF